MEWLYTDRRVVVAIKPAGVLSTDEPGGMPTLVRQALGEPHGCVRTVHRLDRVVGGVMVLARSVKAASILSEQVRRHQLEKTYLAVVHGCPTAPSGELRDYLHRDRSRRRSTVVPPETPEAQEAILRYRLLECREDLSLLEITLETGRTHQIRVQLSSRGLPLVGDRKYGDPEETCPIALWSHGVGFFHPETGERLRFSAPPPDCRPWSLFSAPGENPA